MEEEINILRTLLKAKDLSKLTKKTIVNKRGHRQTVYVKPSQVASQVVKRKKILKKRDNAASEKKKNLPKIGHEYRLGSKDKRSVWTGNMRGGKSVIVLGHDKMSHNKEDVVVVALKEDYLKPTFDPQMDYQLVYPHEINMKSEKKRK